VRLTLTDVLASVPRRARDDVISDMSSRQGL
jgi:hypothetical protein